MMSLGSSCAATLGLAVLVVIALFPFPQPRAPSETEEPGRIVGEDPGPQGCLRHPIREQVEQAAGIHLPVWNVRPVAAPYGSMANRLDNCTSKRAQLRVIAILGDAIRAGELHPAGAVRDGFEQPAEVCPLHTTPFPQLPLI